MIIPREIEVEKEVEKLLIKRELYPFNVFYTIDQSTKGWEEGLLAITLHTSLDLQELLEILDYRSCCDKSGYILLPDYNTLLVTKGSHLIDLWSKL